MIGEENYFLTTATADWTTFDTIGGYMPTGDGNGKLEFRQGKFLDCFKDSHGRNTNRWLIIDEINRADIDKAFGQLFSVLARDKVELPYKDFKSGRPIVIDPSSNGAASDPTTYYVPADWRLIGTMNTYDKASLYEMSFAFMRRFAFIHIDAPDLDEPSIMKEFEKVWNVGANETLSSKIFEVWKDFNKKSSRKIGPAIVEDMLRYCAEHGGEDKIRMTDSFSLYVLPQLEGMREKQIREILGMGSIKNNMDPEKIKHLLHRTCLKSIYLIEGMREKQIRILLIWIRH